jgi:outer membrane protein OmpA-like peptidoglycan-associated protein
VSLPSDPPSNVGSERHVLLMAYGEVDPSKRWKSYIDGTVSERLRDGCKIIVHGHTDDIGVAEVNRKLSHQHAERVAALLQDAIGRKGVDNVDLVFVGHGEDPFDAPLRQESPEGRQYNRSVIIDIVFP